MKIPVGAKVAGLVVAATAFYTYVGQLVPQKEVLPPEEIEIAKNVTTEQLVQIGDRIAHGKGLCLTCHTIGQPPPHRFPDLAGIGARAGSREPGMSAVDYLAQSIYQPGAFIVPGFNPGMPTINKPPIGLTDQEILAVIAWLQSMGGKPTVTLDTKLPYQKGAAASGG